MAHKQVLFGRKLQLNKMVTAIAKRRNQMESKSMENVTDAAVNLAHLTHQVGKAKVLVNDVVEDGKHKVERTFKRAFVSAEDCIEDTSHFIKRHPWQSVGAAVGVGTIVGLFAGWQAGRCCERSQTG